MTLLRQSADFRTNLIGEAGPKPVCAVCSFIFGVEVCKLSRLEQATTMGGGGTAGWALASLPDFSAIHRFIHMDETLGPILRAAPAVQSKFSLCSTRPTTSWSRKFHALGQLLTAFRRKCNYP